MKRQPGPSDELEAILRVASANGWRAGGQQYGDVYPPGRPEATLQRSVGDAVADFLFLIPASTRGIVVSLGADWGALAVALARTCGKVLPINSSPPVLAFGAIRAGQEGLYNVAPICGSALHLPLRDLSCDLVILVDELEWLAVDDLNPNPRNAQEQALTEAFRVLKSGGCVCIAVENRFGWPYLLGVRDHHSGLRFVSVLPRRLADLYSRRVRHAPYREWTPSLRELTQIVHGTGFARMEMHCVLPGIRDFRFTVPIHSRQTMRYTLRKLEAHGSLSQLQSLAMHLASRILVWPALQPRFLVIAFK